MLYCVLEIEKGPIHPPLLVHRSLQRGDNEPTREDEAEGDASEHGLSKDTFTSPSSPTPFREMPPLRLQNFDDEAADPRFHPCARIEFPTFDGKEDPLPWLNCCEMFFRCHNTPERRCVPYASLHLTGTAQLWFYQLELTSGTPSCRRFAQLVQQRFGPPMTNNPVGEIMLLRRDGSVEDYIDKFLALACRDTDLTKSQLVQMYTAGLVDPLKTDIALRQPSSLDDAIMIARAYEQ